MDDADTSTITQPVAADRCTRCQGSGFVRSPRVHLGIPSLCFHCHGDGTRETQLKTLKANGEAQRRSRLEAQKCPPIWEKIYAVRHANRVPHALLRSRWPIIADLRQFSTQEYADKVEITKAEAWVELCCNNRVYVRWSDDFDPIGWIIE